MVMRTIITVACMVRTSASRSPPARGAAATMIFGVDFLFTGALKPLVIEVQVFPNLKAADAGDFQRRATGVFFSREFRLKM